LSHDRFLLFYQEGPTRETSYDQDTRGDGEKGLCSPALIGGPELREITVAGAAGGQVIEPLFRFGQRHLMTSDSLENVRARAPGTVRIRELLEQTTAQRIQDAFFVSLRVPFRVQI